MDICFMKKKITDIYNRKYTAEIIRKMVCAKINTDKTYWVQEKKRETASKLLNDSMSG